MTNTFVFLNDFCLQQRHQMQRRFFPLREIPDSGYNDPRLSPGYSTLQYVPEQGRYLMWVNFNSVFCEIGKTSEQCLLAWAESEDGIHYRPAQGTLSGFPQTDNVVYAGLGRSIHGATVLYDPLDPDPARRFKCAASLDEPGRIMSYSPSTISISPDGSHWSAADERYVWSRFWSDTYNALIYNPVLECYQVFCRAAGTDRRICTVTSKDLLHWSEPRLVLQPDGTDGPNKEFYAMPVFYHNGIFYGHLWIYETDDEDPVAYKMAGRNYPELTYSYDGLYWMRTYQKAVEMPDYDSDGYGVFNITLYNTILNRESDAWLTVGTMTRNGHADGMYKHKDSNHLPSAFKVGDPANGRRPIFRMKPGRNCGLESIGLSGRIHTKNFLVDRDGPVPSINVSCRYGEMRVQLCGTMNNPIPGFTFADCVPFRGDELAYVPKWKTRSMDETLGKLFNMEIELHNGCIYGISGAMMPFHGSIPQYSYGNVNPAAEHVWGTLEKAPDYDGVELR